MQLFSPNMQVSFSSGAEFLKMFMFNFCHFLFKICRVPVWFFFDDFCSWRLKSCLWWLWCPACIILPVSSLYHQIQGSSCRPVLGNPSVTQSCHVCILQKISFLLIFVKCDKPSYFKDLGEKQGLWFEMRFCYCAGIFYFYLELGQALPRECVC